MSKVKIEGNASGTGTLTIAAPNTNTDRSLTLPDEAGEFVTADGSGDVTLSGDITAVDATLSGGVYLGGTGSANYLDDYEEGTWTPTVLGSSTAGTMTQPNSSYQTTPSGNYTKIGRKVYLTANFNGVALTGASGNLFLGGLPFSFSLLTGVVTYLEGFDPRFNKSLGGSYGTNKIVLRGTGNSVPFRPGHSYAWDTYLDANTTKWDGGGNGVHGNITLVGYI